jgi:membrane protein DedA with SNARE-associated domain
MYQILEHFIQTYGYYALFLGTFAEGETILVLGGIAAATGHLNLQLVMLIAFCGSLLGDQTIFFIGRIWGKAFLAKRPRLQPRVAKVHRLLERHHVLLLLGFRFLYGLRNIIPLVIATSNVKTSRFIMLNVMGAAMWAISVSFLGYFLGQLVVPYLGRAKLVILIAVALLAVLIWVLRHLYQRFVAEPPPPPPPADTPQA